MVEAWRGGTPWYRLTMSSSPAPPKVSEQLGAGELSFRPPLFIEFDMKVGEGCTSLLRACVET